MNPHSLPKFQPSSPIVRPFFFSFFLVGGRGNAKIREHLKVQNICFLRAHSKFSHRGKMAITTKDIG